MGGSSVIGSMIEIQSKLVPISYSLREDYSYHNLFVKYYTWDDEVAEHRPTNTEHY